MVKTEGNAGRPSKVDVWGLADEIDELRSKGMSQQAIANQLNIDIPELNISEDCISRYLRGATKTTTKDYHIDLVDYLTNVFQQIVYEVDRSKSLDKNDRKALMRCLENKRKQMNKAKISTSLSFLNQKPNHLFFYSFYWCALIVKKSERCGGNYS
jgi:predicted transcriptional regulator